EDKAEDRRGPRRGGAGARFPPRRPPLARGSRPVGVAARPDAGLDGPTFDLAEGGSDLSLPVLADADRTWWKLAAGSGGLYMIMLDNTVVNVALPSIRADLGISISELEWVVNAYALTFGVLLLTGGKLADLLGRRAIFTAGLVIFTGASLWCGLAGTAGSLIAARSVQGVGAALMNPATLSIITATFPPRQRGAAIGIWAGVSALALAIGPLVGGLLTQKIGWSWIFFINIPVGVLGVLAARAFIH